MATTQLVKDFLRKQGFFFEENSENGNIDFKYEMKNFLFINNDEDEEYFQLIMPQIYAVTEDNRDMCIEAANKVNLNTKVVKACVLDNGVWLFIESILDYTPQIETVLPRALRILQYAYQQFYKAIG
jgi:hypothetical protein